jgi:excisionase family DNA binding protein
MVVMRIAYTVEETAEMLGISKSSVYWMCWNKELKHNRIKARGCNGKGKILISKSAIEKWLEGGIVN